MGTRTLETDYLVVGCGAAGMAFAGALIAASDAEVVMVDRRHAPGGHWNDAYPFVRLQNLPRDWAVGTLAATQAAYLWLKEPDLQEWLEGARLYWLRGLRRHFGEPRVQQAHRRYTGNVRPALANLQKLLARAAA